MAFLTMYFMTQPAAAGRNGFRLFLGFEGGLICRWLPLVATTGLHKGSILCRRGGHRRAA
jgi:hypothetical protein